MSTLTALVPAITGNARVITGNATKPFLKGLENVKTAQQKTTIAGQRKIVHGKRFMLSVACTAAYRVAEYLIPDDAYDWEDDAVAEFLGEDLNA